MWDNSAQKPQLAAPPEFDVNELTRAPAPQQLFFKTKHKRKYV
jgi:hypothetical protein